MRIITLSLMLLALPAMATIRGSRKAYNDITLSTGFTTAGKILDITDLQHVEGVQLKNDLNVEVAVNCSTARDTIPNDTSNQNIYVIAGEGWSVDNADLGAIKHCYARAVSGIASSGALKILLKGF